MSDVVGSTELWQREGTRMDRALADLDREIRSHVGEHGGTVIKSRGEGDSHFAAFDRASSALRAAVDLQRSRSDVPWPKVRVALHAGEADPEDGDYVGALVNWTARLRSAAHGGQVVCSRVVADLVGDVDGVALQSLGTHRIKDLSAPIELFQAAGDGLPADFPPLVTLDAAATAVMTIVVVDHVGSIEVALRHPIGMHEWQRPLFRSLRAAARLHDGRFLKLLGDGCIVAFEDPRAGLAFARSVCEEASTAGLRGAVTAGIVDVVEGELSGAAVFEAFASVKHADAGSVWVSHVVHGLVGALASFRESEQCIAGRCGPVDGCHGRGST